MNLSCDCNKIDIPPYLLPGGAPADPVVNREGLVSTGDPTKDPMLTGPDTPGTLRQKLVSGDPRITLSLREIDNDRKLSLSLNMPDASAGTQTAYGTVFLATNAECQLYYAANVNGYLPRTFVDQVRYGVVQPNQVHWASNDGGSSTAKDIYNKNLDGRVGVGVATPTQRLHVKGGNALLEDSPGVGGIGVGGALILNRSVDLTPASSNWADFPVGSVWGFGGEIYAKLAPTERYKLNVYTLGAGNDFGLPDPTKVAIFVLEP